MRGVGDPAPQSLPPVDTIEYMGNVQLRPGETTDSYVIPGHRCIYPTEEDARKHAEENEPIYRIDVMRIG